ncbi:uncharacterized protein LOC111713532 [Eurytemora carolleeae]|uniref:uncharacterized protein LOC111713532 n=1 Tax=Eurytemora carolleeae TaxID=1294199 RepID=UPI000C77A80C|nr:uncharacterized protein LOC111713532 [Eurytemora carolleeae]|eukprot:XP_023344172.1 uncharacterized protein LOC111713532 [Eurytemora affinis]
MRSTRFLVDGVKKLDIQPFYNLGRPVNCRGLINEHWCMPELGIFFHNVNGVVKPSYESRVTKGIWNYDLEIQCMDPVSCITTISSVDYTSDTLMLEISNKDQQVILRLKNRADLSYTETSGGQTTLGIGSKPAINYTFNLRSWQKIKQFW